MFFGDAQCCCAILGRSVLAPHYSAFVSWTCDFCGWIDHWPDRLKRSIAVPFLGKLGDHDDDQRMQKV